MGHPQKSFKSIHVAGTKGKGSTATYLARIAGADGRKVGLYTSPQVLDERDRIQVNDRPISWDEFRREFEVVEGICRKNRINPTVFEIFTLMAFSIFRRNRVEWAVIEVGLGGRLDSTNVVVPEASVITPIHFDHMDKLGRTLAAIAGEKAGIIKKGVPVFTSAQSPAAALVIRKKAKQMRSSLTAGVRSLPGEWSGISLPSFQKRNLALALKVSTHLGFSTDYVALQQKILKGIPGRFFQKDNLILDGAHNPFAVRHLVRALKDLPGGSKRYQVVFFAMPDKPLEKMLALFPSEWKVYYFQMKLTHLQQDHLELLKKKFPRIPVLRTWEDFERINDGKKPMLVTGSFSLVSYFLKNLSSGHP